MIDPDKLYSYFDKHHGPVYPSTNGWYNCTCPFCGKPKFAFMPEAKVGKCWTGCFKGFVVDVIMQYHQLDYFNSLELIESMDVNIFQISRRVPRRINRSEVILPNGYVPILQGATVLGVRARNYLVSRGFDLNYMDRLGVGYCIEEADIKEDNFFGYIIIPFNKKGILSYYIGRDFIGNFLRYKNPAKEKFGVGKEEVFFNEEALYLQDTVYVTEGWSCAATIGSRGVSIQGSSPGDIQLNIMIKSQVKEFVLIPDAGYYKKGLEAAMVLLPYKKVKVLNLIDLFNAGFGKDVNEIGWDKVSQLADTSSWMSKIDVYKELRNEGPINSHKKI